MVSPLSLSLTPQPSRLSLVNSQFNQNCVPCPTVAAATNSKCSCSTSKNCTSLPDVSCPRMPEFVEIIILFDTTVTEDDVRQSIADVLAIDPILVTVVLITRDANTFAVVTIDRSASDKLVHMIQTQDIAV